MNVIKECTNYHAINYKYFRKLPFFLAQNSSLISRNLCQHKSHMAAQNFPKVTTWWYHSASTNGFSSGKRLLLFYSKVRWCETLLGWCPRLGETSMIDFSVEKFWMLSVGKKVSSSRQGAQQQQRQWFCAILPISNVAQCTHIIRVCIKAAYWWWWWWWSWWWYRSARKFSISY